MKKDLFSSEPMIGIFNDSFPPVMDGVAVAAQNYAYWLQKKVGHTCVVTPDCPGLTSEGHYPIYKYKSFPIPFRKPYRYGFPYVDRKFLSGMQQLPFELVHAHCPFSSGSIALRIARQQHIPMIATFHSKYRQDFERIIPNKYIVDYIIKNIINFYEQADEVWIPQAEVEETLREYGYKGRVEVVDNGSDMLLEDDGRDWQPEARRELGIGENENVFLFVGQHIWEKNIAFVLEALERLGDMPYRMYFIGTGYAAKEIAQLVIKKGLGNKVKLLGRITDRQLLKEYYAAADLFLFPSLYDNAPLVVREAAAMKTPAILLEDSTSAGIIRNGWNGFLTTRSTADYAMLIRELVCNRERIREAGANASKTIAKPWSGIIDEVIDRYKSIIDRKCVYCV
jgi:1,2-diacylglycerol 3-alpha-glucosyltransferase